MTNDVVGLCRDLIRFDTSNHGNGSGPGERLAAEYVAERLDAAGLAPEIIEPAPRRTSVVARVEGRDSARPALLLHGHLDVVPARAEEWSVDPFAGEIRDGCLWGRGAVDMKNMNAMILSALAAMAAEGRRPSRDVVVAFLADEEAGGRHGSFWLAEHRRELFEDCAEAVSEVGGFSVTVGTGSRLYLVETARKGVLWLRLRARGTAGHASLTNRDNPVTRLAGAVARLGAHEWPLRPTPTTRRMTETIAAATGADPAADDLTGTSIELIGPLLTSSMRHVANPTMLAGADAINIVPAMAEARVDGRFVAGGEDDFLRQVAEIVGPEIEIEVLDRTPAGESDSAADLVARMAAALAAEDDGARVVPYCTSASTDNAAFAPLGIQGFGFVPLRLPAGFDFAAMFHGRDERVPLESLRFGARVLDRFLTDC